MAKSRIPDLFVGSSLPEGDVAKRLKEEISSKIQGIEKVYVPFYEFPYLVTFEDSRKPDEGTYWCDPILSSCRLLPKDFNEERLVDRRGGTLLPSEVTVDEARKKVREVILSRLPNAINRGLGYNLTLEFSGRYYVPFWVAYFQASRPGTFDFIVFDSQRGQVDKIAKEIVDRGFLILDERKDKLPPWF